MNEVGGFAALLAAPKTLWMVWAAAVIIFGIVFLLLEYHWRPHALHDPHIKKMAHVYIFVSCALLVIAAVLLLTL